MSNYKNASGKPKITREIEQKVFELRLSGMYQRQIARELGLSPATINLLCKGKYNFRSDTPARTAAIQEQYLKVAELERKEAIHRLRLLIS